MKTANLWKECEPYKKRTLDTVKLIAVLASIGIVSTIYFLGMNYVLNGGVSGPNDQLNMLVILTVCVSGLALMIGAARLLSVLGRERWHAWPLVWLRFYWNRNWAGYRVIVWRCADGTIGARLLEGSVFGSTAFAGKTCFNAVIRDSANDTSPLDCLACDGACSESSPAIKIEFPVGGVHFGDRLRVASRFVRVSVTKVWWSGAHKSMGLPRVRLEDDHDFSKSHVDMDLVTALDFMWLSQRLSDPADWLIDLGHLVERYVQANESKEKMRLEQQKRDHAVRSTIVDMWKLAHEFKQTTRLLSSSKEGLKMYIILLEKLLAAHERYDQIVGWRGELLPYDPEQVQDLIYSSKDTLKKLQKKKKKSQGTAAA